MLSFLRRTVVGTMKSAPELWVRTIFTGLTLELVSGRTGIEESAKLKGLVSPVQPAASDSKSLERVAKTWIKTRHPLAIPPHG